MEAVSNNGLSYAFVPMLGYSQSPWYLVAPQAQTEITTRFLSVSQAEMNFAGGGLVESKVSL